MKANTKKLLIFGLLGLIILISFSYFTRDVSPPEQENVVRAEPMPDYSNSRYKELYLAGGCFWGVQAYFDRMLGVVYTNVGYANGENEETDYYSIEETGHAETLYVVYDSEILSLEELLGYFYGIIEPTVLNRQGNDIGTQYRTGIYYVDPGDLETIEIVTAKEQEKHSQPIVTEIEELQNYVLAEDYHQDYLVKNPGGYCHVDLSNIPRERPGVYKNDYPKPSDADIKAKLTSLQYSITQENATETPFQNPYWNNEDEGIYVDIVTGEPLFLSVDKFDSGSGWPSFSRPLQREVLTYHRDESLGMARTEVRSRSGDSHLGHVFDDGPAEEGGLRYCINSGALRFIHVDDMEKEGYGDFLVYFR